MNKTNFRHTCNNSHIIIKLNIAYKIFINQILQFLIDLVSPQKRMADMLKLVRI